MRVLVRLLVTLVVLGLVAVVADRGADWYAEREAATALTRTLSSSPEVAIEGFPFLTQWGTGRFGEASVTADQVTVGRTKVNDFAMTVSDVRTPAYASSEQDVLASTAGSVRMSGTVPYSALRLPAGVTAKRNGDSTDRMKLSGEVEVLGQQVEFDAVVRVVLEDGEARLKPRRIELLGPVPSAAVTGLVRNHLDIVVRPPGLPPGMQVSTLRVAEDGLRLTATGRDVQIPKE